MPYLTGLTNLTHVEPFKLNNYLNDPDPIRLDPYSGTTTYYGYAHPGTYDTDPTWRIKKYTISGTTGVFQYADGDKYFDNVWADRTGLTYY